MTYWLIIIAAFIATSYCSSYWIKKKHNVPGKAHDITVLIGILLWLSFFLGLYLRTCLV
jgi:hypothetical protein